MYNFDQLRDEIIRPLSADGGNVTVEVIIDGEKADGFSGSIARAMRENSVYLGLEFTPSHYTGEPNGTEAPGEMTSIDEVPANDTPSTAASQ